MPPPPPPPLTLLVAATHSTLGIGHRSTLPWPPLRSEMAYFARVTRRAPAGRLNAVVMGRKTWESIPAAARPLRGRVNVVVTRRGALEHVDKGAGAVEEGPYAVRSLSEGWEVLAGRDVHRVFVIGGAEIYAAALAGGGCRRVLLTRVWTDFECDTFFPLRLGGGEGGWVRRRKGELDRWVGEVVPEGRREEGGVEWEFEMWEREGGEGEREGGEGESGGGGVEGLC